MCFRIPGQVVAVDPDQPQLAHVDVDGSRREVSLAMLADDPPDVGDWVLIHMGVAIEVIDRERADEVREGLQLVGRAQQQALDELEASWLARDRGGQPTDEPQPDDETDHPGEEPS